jgi:hypothetical protein
MADNKISDLAAPGPLTDADLLELEQPGETAGVRSRKLTLAGLLAWVVGKFTEPATALTITSGTITLDFAGKSRASFTLALTANVTTVNFSNLAGAGLVTEFDLEITQDATGGRTFALPAALKALGGSDTAIASAANAVTVLSAKTFDNGTTWRYAMQESA